MFSCLFKNFFCLIFIFYFYRLGIYIEVRYSKPCLDFQECLVQATVLISKVKWTVKAEIRLFLIKATSCFPHMNILDATNRYSSYHTAIDMVR